MAVLEPEKQEVKEELLSSGYVVYTDLATLLLNCQARSVAIFRGLVMAGLIGEVRDYKHFLNFSVLALMGKRLGRRLMNMFRYCIKVR